MVWKMLDLKIAPSVSQGHSFVQFSVKHLCWVRPLLGPGAVAANSSTNGPVLLELVPVTWQAGMRTVWGKVGVLWEHIARDLG